MIIQIHSLHSLLVGILAFALVGCYSTDPYVQQARSDFQSRKTYTQGIVGGALIGAAAGALIGGLNNRKGGESFNTKGALAGAGIGAAAGGVAGGVYAHNKVQQRKQYLAMERNLDNAIKNASETRIAARKFNQTLRSRLTAIRAEKTNIRGTIADSKAVLRSIDSEITRQQKFLQYAQSNSLSASDRNRLKSEIGGLRAERSQLVRHIESLTPERTETAPPPLG